MKTNFRILIHRSDSSLHLKLLGEFDEKAARELLHTLKRRAAKMSRVFIHTGGLNGVYPPGPALFNDKCRCFLGTSPPLIFTGDHAGLLAPTGSVRISAKGGHLS